MTIHSWANFSVWAMSRRTILLRNETRRLKRLQDLHFQLVWVTEFNVSFSVYFSLVWNIQRRNYLGFTKQISVADLERNNNSIVKVFICIYVSAQLRKRIWTLSVFYVGKSSSLKPEILVQNLYQLSRNCIFLVDHFILSHPVYVYSRQSECSITDDNDDVWNFELWFGAT